MERSVETDWKSREERMESEWPTREKLEARRAGEERRCMVGGWQKLSGKGRRSTQKGKERRGVREVR